MALERCSQRPTRGVSRAHLCDHYEVKPSELSLCPAHRLAYLALYAIASDRLARYTARHHHTDAYMRPFVGNRGYAEVPIPRGHSAHSEHAPEGARV